MSPRHMLMAASALGALAAPTAAFAQASASPFTAAQRFDAMGRVTGTISPDPDGTGPLPHRATRNTYDAAGRLVKVETGTLAAWQSETIAPANWTGFTVHQTLVTRYDSMSRKVREVLSSSHSVHSVTEYSYDTVGRLACTAARMNPAAFPPADGSGTVPNACTQGTAGTFGPDRITRNVYDAAGQRLQAREGVGTAIEAAEAWAYNLNGQVTTIIDGNGNRAEYRYDGHGRQTRWVFPSPTEPASYNDSTPATALATAGAVNEADYEQYGYDPNGNRTSLRLRDGNSIAFGYDALNRMTVKDLPGTEPTVTYAYNLLGAQTLASDGTYSVINAYDGLNRPASETSYMGTKYYQYDAAGRRTRLSYPQGFEVGYSYLDTGEMTEIRENPTGANVQIITLGYDSLGRRTSIGRANGAATGYAYDGAGRLQSLSHDLAGTASDVTFAFEYNPASQITRRTSSNAAYSYTELANMNRPDEHNGLNQITTHGATGITHDLRGNITNDGARTFAYDSQNRLVHSGGPDNLWLFYDPLGRLLALIPGAGAHEYPDHDGDRMIAEHNGSGVVQRRYVHGPGVDETLVWYEGSTTADRRYLHADERGSIIAISNSSGAALAINRYDEYGVPQGTHTGRFGYTGQAWIERANIWHYKARIYHPRLGRFMQVDPIGYEDQINLYAYVQGDPLNLVDPHGTRALVWGGRIFIQPEDTRFPSVSIPNNVGAVGFDRFHAYWHQYLIGTQTNLRNLADASRSIANNPTPGNDRPATAGGTRNDVGPLRPLDRGDNIVRSFLIPSPNRRRYSDIVVNYTVSGEHMAQEGFVMQFAERMDDGTLRFRAYGEGNAFEMRPGFSWIWRKAAGDAWHEVQRQQIFDAARPR